MTPRQARAAAAKHEALAGAAKAAPAKHDPAIHAPLRLYSVYLLGMFAAKPGPARGGK